MSFPRKRESSYTFPGSSVGRAGGCAKAQLPRETAAEKAG